MICTRCNGKGSVPCPELFSLGTHAIFSHMSGLSDRCHICNGLKEVQCPACQGKPIYEIEEQNKHLVTSKKQVAADQNHSEIGKRRAEKRGQGGTHYQSLLAIHYLLKSASAKENNTKKAQFARFLTGFSDETFRQTWSNIHGKKDQNGVNWEADMKTVRAYFEDLGLAAAVHLIDEDLKDLSSKL